MLFEKHTRFQNARLNRAVSPALEGAGLRGAGADGINWSRAIMDSGRCKQDRGLKNCLTKGMI